MESSHPTSSDSVKSPENETPEKISMEKEDPTQKITELEAQIKEKESKYLYLYADFENFKKRTMKERSDLIKFGWESIARELLQIIDNLELAIQHAPPASDQKWLAGLQLVLSHFKSTLEKQGVQPIETIQKPFDPYLHETVQQEPSEQPPGTILKEHSRGYTLHGRLLRPSRVTISSGKPSESLGK